MEQALSSERPSVEQNRRLAEVMGRERERLGHFIRARVADAGDAEDILQDVFYELVEAYRLMKPVEQVGAWLFRVARNRIIDLFRKQRPQPFSESAHADYGLEDLLPSADAGPEAAYARSELMEQIEAALDELPAEQRDVFIAHEIEGRSFQELAEESGVNINTLLARKRYAVLFLRRRLQAIRNEFTGNQI